MSPFATVIAPAFVEGNADRFPPFVCTPINPRAHRVLALPRILFTLASFPLALLLKGRRLRHVILLFRLLAHK